MFEFHSECDGKKCITDFKKKRGKKSRSSTCVCHPLIKKARKCNSECFNEKAAFVCKQCSEGCRDSVAYKWLMEKHTPFKTIQEVKLAMQKESE